MDWLIDWNSRGRNTYSFVAIQIYKLYNNLARGEITGYFRIIYNSLERSIMRELSSFLFAEWASQRTLSDLGDGGIGIIGIVVGYVICYENIVEGIVVGMGMRIGNGLMILSEYLEVGLANTIRAENTLATGRFKHLFGEFVAHYAVDEGHSRETVYYSIEFESIQEGSVRIPEAIFSCNYFLATRYHQVAHLKRIHLGKESWYLLRTFE